MNMKNGFVYKWTNKKSGMVYVGRHAGSINDGYIASSPDFLRAYEVDKQNWKRDILFAGDYEEVKKQEIIYIKESVKCYGINNIFNKCSAAKTATNELHEYSQGKLYGMKKEIDLKISQLQDEIEKLKNTKSTVEIALKKYSIKGRKMKKDVANDILGE